ncbi:MAG: tetratricopeptide repeat protein [Fibrobacterota bacterium]|nr:tetratricopeptide repeat protein [Fibrobacterota bacterium]
MPAKPNLKSRIFLLAIATCLAIGHGRPKEDELRLQVARQWEEKGEFDKAVQELRLYLSEHPDSPEIYARIGGLRMKQGNFKLAGENYKIALSKNPNLTQARVGLANAYEKAGDKSKADEERKKLPHSSKAASKAASNAAAAPIDEAFSPALDSISSQGPQGIYTQKEFQEALGLYRDKKADVMAGALRRSLAKTPGHAGAFYLGGVMRYEGGEFGKALFNFKRGVEYPDRGHNSWYYMGRIYQKQERFQDAIAAYEKYLAKTQSEAGRKQAEAYLAQMRGGKHPSEKDSHSVKAGEGTDLAAKSLGEAHEHGHAKDGHEAGKAHSEEPAKAAPPATFTVLGRDGSFFFLVPDEASPSGKKLMEAYDFCKREKFEKAVITLKETLLNYGGSDNAQAGILDLASVYLRLGLWESARDRLGDYLGSGIRDSVKYFDAAQYLTALAHLGLKDGEKAEKALLKIKAGAPAGPVQEEIDYRLSQAGELLQDSKKWSAYLEKAQASAKDPLRKATLAQKLGFLHAKYGGTDRAMDYFRKSMVDCKDSNLVDLCSESRLRLADMAFRKKDWKGAMDLYRQFAAMQPDHRESAWVQYQMANIYKVTNNFESALNQYKRVIDNYPDSYWASQAKWKREDAIWQKEYEEVLD